MAKFSQKVKRLALTESEIFTVKYQTEAFLYWPSKVRLIQHGRYLLLFFYMALFITIFLYGTFYYFLFMWHFLLLFFYVALFITIFFYMALFINFSYRYLRLVQLCQNADNGD